MATVTVPSVALPNPGDDMDAEQVRDWITNVISFLEGTNTDEANVDTSGTDGIVGKSVAQTITGLKTWESTSAGGGGVREVIKLGLNPSSGTPANSDGARITVYADDAGGTAGDRAYLDVLMEAATAGAVNAYVRISTDVADTVTAGFAVGKLDTYLDVYAPARTHTAATNTYVAYIRPGGAQTIPAGTTGLVAGLRVDEPNITATGTVTNAATVYVANAPTEGGTGNYALWVDDGSVKFDGTLTVDGLATHGGNVVSDTDSTDSLGTTSVRWANLYVDNLGDSGQDLAVGATVLSFAGSSTIDTSANTLTLSGTLTTSGTTWTNLGAVTTVDINGGTVDGVIIGGASAAAGTFTVVTATDVDATAGTISSNATTFSFDAGATIDTSGNNALTLNAGTAALTITAGDATLYDATNNADTSLSIGTSATERVLIQALNGAANQSLESLNIVTQTAAAGANAGQITIGVDDATILTIDDGGINAILGATTAAAATVTTLTASSTVNIQTATNWQLGSVAFTGTMANLNTLRDDSMADALHRHSELSASDGTPNPAVWVTAAGSVGIGTATAPHGGVGAALLALEGADGSTSGPHIQFTTAADDYPLLQILPWAHDTIDVALDAYFNGTNWVSSDAGSNFMLQKATDKFIINKASGVAAGSTISTWTQALILDAAGNVGIGVVPEVWAATYSAFQLGGLSAWATVTTPAAGNFVYWTNNVYTTSAVNPAYIISSEEASRYYQANGTHVWETAGTGTADATITFTEVMRTTAAGQLLVGTATASANAAGPSLLIAQGAADDKVLLFGSSDVAHGRTTLLETDKYASFAKSVATGGGLTITGISDAEATTGNYSLQLLGYTADVALDTTKTTAGLAAVVIAAGITDGGTSCTTPGANENLMVIQAYATTRFIFDQEGSGHADVEWVAFADHDDLAMVRDLEREMIPSRFGQALIYNREAFERVGIVGKNSWHEENGRQHAMVNFTRLAQLHHGAIGQIGERMEHLETAVAARDLEIAELRRQMALLKEVN